LEALKTMARSDDYLDASKMPTRGVLSTIRIIWAAMLAGELGFLGVIFFLLRGGNAPPPAQTDSMRILFFVSIVFLAGGVVVGFVLRSRLYNPRQADGSVVPGRYVTGNIIFYALCEGPAFFGLVVCMLSGHFLPAVAVPAVAMAVQLLNFPTGAPLEPTGIPQRPR
jgi:hypothetical protein